MSSPMDEAGVERDASNSLQIPDGNDVARNITRFSIDELKQEARKSVQEGRIPDFRTEEQKIAVDNRIEGIQRGKCCAACHFILGNLTLKTLLGVILGFLLGSLLREANPSQDWITIIAYPGELFVNALKMVVIPLIGVGMILAVIKLGDISKVKRIGTRALAYYTSTTFIAAVEGLIVVNIFNPGKGEHSNIAASNCKSNSGIFCSELAANLANDTKAKLFASACANTTGYVCQSVDLPQKATLDAFLDVGRTMLPPNIMVAFTETNILGIIVFCLLFGFYLNQEDKSEVVVVQKFLGATNGALMRIVEALIWWTPIGIFSLVCGEVLKAENLWGDLAKLAMFVVTVVVGIAMHAFVVYPSIYFFATGKNPCAYYKNLMPPVLTAFATSSSAATLPVTINAVESAGVHTDISRFILPLGATINMDGTAIYFPIAVIFLANWSGFALTAGQQISISVVSAFVSIGAAPIPSAGLVYLLLIMNSVGIPATGNISLVLAIDWFLDRLQTCCNVCGDSFGSGILEHYRQKDIALGIVSEEESYLAGSDDMEMK